MTLSDVSLKKGTGCAMPCSLNRIFLVMYRCSQTHKMNAEQEEWIFGRYTSRVHPPGNRSESAQHTESGHMPAPLHTCQPEKKKENYVKK